MKPAELLDLVCAGPEDSRPAPKAVIVAAHPDDEAIGAGARLPRLRHAAILHVTDGSPRSLYDAHSYGFSTREEYAEARRRERNAALALAGIAAGQACELGCVDQEAAQNLVGLTLRLSDLLREISPEVVLTHPYEGGHPDHDATAFIVHAACRLLQQKQDAAPVVMEMTSYHNGPDGLTPFDFLPYEECAVTTLVLSDEERAFKRRLLDCFPTQQGTIQYFPVEVERFRVAPRYDFTRPPHPGQLFYECFDWGMTGAQFQSLACAAMQTLGLTGDV